MSNFIRRLQRMGPGASIVVEPTGPGGGSTGVRMYLSPVSGSYATGNTLQVQIRIDSGSIEVNSYQANISYPIGQLQFESTSTAGSPFTTVIVNTGSDGLVRLSAAIMAGSTSGDQLLGTATFTAVGAGSAALSYTDGSGVAQASDSTAVANQFDGATYTIT